MAPVEHGNDGLLASPGPLLQESWRTFALSEVKIMMSMGWPMLVSFFSRMAMASVDSAFVGHINDGQHSAGTYLAAAGLSDMVTGLLVIPPLAFNQSLNMLVGQAMGAAAQGTGNKKMAGTWLQLSLFWLTVGYIPCLFSFFYVADMLRILGFDEEICLLAGKYSRWNVFWPIPNGWYQCMRFYFQAQQITRPAMYNNLFFLGVNVLLNWIFVFGGPFWYWFGWEGFGFVGAAMSLSISRSSQPLAYWLYMFVWRGAHKDTWPGWSWKFCGKTKEFLTMAVPQIGTLIVQAAIGQSTTLLLAQLGTTAIAASSATAAATQVFTGGLQPTLTAMSGIRTAFWLGNGEPQRASRVGWVALGLGGGATVIVALVLLPISHQVMGVVTSDTTVANIGAGLLAPMMLSIFAGIAVQVGTGGVITSQGRPKLVTFLSMGFELPLSLGSVAVLVLFFHASIQKVYWAQALVMVVEMAVVWWLIVRSDWTTCAREAQERQKEVASAAPSPDMAMRSPAVGSLKSSPMLGHPPTIQVIDAKPNEPRADQALRDAGLHASGVSLPDRGQGV